MSCWYLWQPVFNFIHSTEDAKYILSHKVIFLQAHIVVKSLGLIFLATCSLTWNSAIAFLQSVSGVSRLAYTAKTKET